MNESSVKPFTSGADREQDPAAVVAAIEARGTRHETPCGDGHMVWRRWGAGAPVILIHGGAGSWSHWIRNVEPLAERHTVWVLDLPGFGESALPEQLSIEAIADAVEQGIGLLIPNNELVNVVGFSFGSSIAATIGARLNSRLCNLVLMGARFTWFSKRVKQQLVAWKAIVDPAERLAAHRKNLEIMMIADPKKVDALAVYLQSANTRRARISGRKWKPNSDDKLHEYFPQVRARGKVMVIFGRGDKGALTIIDNEGIALRDPQPAVSFRIVENAGHWVQYEAADQINEILLAEFSASEGDM